MSPLFEYQITTLELKFLYNIIVFSKNLGHYLFFEESNIFVEILEVGFFALQRKKTIFGFMLSSIDIAQDEEIL